MFDNLKSMGQIGSLMSKAREMQAKMAEFESRRPALRATGAAGGNMVTATASGDMQIVGLVFAPEALSGDGELLADLTRAAINQALKSMQDLVQDEMTKLAGDVDVSAFKGLMGGE